MKCIKAKGIEVVFETILKKDLYKPRVIKGFEEFKEISYIIVANRMSGETLDVIEKV